MKRAIAAIGAALLAGLLLATPAHATPVPSPSPSPTPTVTTPADPCALPSPTATLEEIPQVEGKALDMRRRPKLPLPVHCFVTFVHQCEHETDVTLHNPIPHIVIKYRVADEDTTRTLSFGETETFPISVSPFKVFIVLDDEGTHPFLVTVHRYVEPKGCQTASPSPSVSPSAPVTESPEPQLPVTGTNYVPAIGAAGGATALLLGIGVWALVSRRRRSAA